MNEFYKQLEITTDLLCDHQRLCERVLYPPALRRQNALGVSGETPFECLSERDLVRIAQLNTVSLANINTMFPLYRYSLSDFLNVCWERMSSIRQMGEGLRFDNTLRTIFEKLKQEDWMYHDTIVVLLLVLCKHIPKIQRIRHLNALTPPDGMARYFRIQGVIGRIFHRSEP